ncbi:unnamed protein product [Amoebophrya sp. A120]|nr:unnamed protein product [Amoebophrya sp. A120]|eukprot:GSA120T00010918001.1
MASPSNPFSQLGTKLGALLALTAGIGVLYSGPDSSKLFFWHPFFTILAVLPLATSGIFVNVYNSKIRTGGKVEDREAAPVASGGAEGAASTEKTRDHEEKKPQQRLANLWHNLLLISATVAMWSGYYVIHTNKEINGKPHLTTLHGRLGFIVLIAYTTIVLSSSLPLWDYPQKMPSRAVVSTMRLMKLSVKNFATLHRYTGRILYLAAIATMATGWWTIHAASNVKYAASLFALPILGLLY